MVPIEEQNIFKNEIHQLLIDYFRCSDEHLRCLIYEDILLLFHVINDDSINFH